MLSVVFLYVKQNVIEITGRKSILRSGSWNAAGVYSPPIVGVVCKASWSVT